MSEGSTVGHCDLTETGHSDQIEKIDILGCRQLPEQWRKPGFRSHGREQATDSVERVIATIARRHDDEFFRFRSFGEHMIGGGLTPAS